MADNENKAYDYRHDILGQNGLSMASGPLTMKSPLIGSGKGSGEAEVGFTIMLNHFVEFTEDAPIDTYTLTCDKTFSELVAMREEASNNHSQVLGKLIGRVMTVDGGEPTIAEEYTHYGILYFDSGMGDMFVIFLGDIENMKEWGFDRYADTNNPATNVIHISNPDTIDVDKRAYGFGTMKTEVTAVDNVTVPRYFDADGNMLKE